MNHPKLLRALETAYEFAALSKDPSTQIGAVVTNPRGDILGAGYNHFPKGVKETTERWKRPTKYPYVVHAEVSAILDSLRGGPMYPLSECVLVAPWYACTDCAKVIIESGIRRVIGHQNLRDFAEVNSPGWTVSIQQSLDMMIEAGVMCEWYIGEVPDAMPILVGGNLFDPETG